MPKILTINGSPVKNSCTEVLLEKVTEGIEKNSAGSFENKIIKLNDLNILPCQACGENPEPDYCLFKDDIYPFYKYLINCDIVLFGSPIYFETVSAQAKLFIDRCNCLRPPDFAGDSDAHFKKVITKKKLGAIILSGGQSDQFECARRVIAGFFKWVRVTNIGTINYTSPRWKEAGLVKDDIARLDKAILLGEKINLSLP